MSPEMIKSLFKNEFMDLSVNNKVKISIDEYLESIRVTVIVKLMTKNILYHMKFINSHIQ